ncbi:MAG TPA: response regulator transcription factor [Thermoanaerobaculia bacterium]
MAIRIVLADDHPIVLNGLDQLFSREPDIEVTDRCTNGVDAVAAVKRERPDVLVADLRMPGMGGLEILGVVQSEAPSTRVVLLTARIDHEEVLEAIRGGVGGIVLKESAPRQIIGCVRKVAGGEQWLDESVSHRALDTILRREAGATRAGGILTPREIEVARMVARGLRNREIAETLFITEGTVKVHLHTIFEKLGISRRMQLAAYAREQMLV